MKDPYFRRLSSTDKRAFWKIFNQCCELSEYAKDLFEKMTERDPSQRISIADIKLHPWLQGEILDDEQIIKEMNERSTELKRMMIEQLAQQCMENNGTQKQSENRSESSQSSEPDDNTV